MIENGLKIDMNKKEKLKGVKWRERVKRHIRVEVRQRRKESGW